MTLAQIDSYISSPGLDGGSRLKAGLEPDDDDDDDDGGIGGEASLKF